MYLNARTRVCGLQKESIKYQHIHTKNSEETMNVVSKIVKTNDHKTWGPYKIS